MVLQAADYAIIAFTSVMAIMGLFRGLSGMIAFIAATVVSVFAASFGWTYSAEFSEVVWIRAIGDLVATLIVFGLIRLIIKKAVNGILSQPSDSIFGMFLGLISGTLVVITWAKSGVYLEYSNLVKEVANAL